MLERELGFRMAPLWPLKNYLAVCNEAAASEATEVRLLINVLRQEKAQHWFDSFFEKLPQAR